MELDITRLTDTDAFPYSHSQMEGGENAGRNTWNAAKEDAPDLLDTDEKVSAFMDYVAEFGAWDQEEREAWTHEERCALLLQFIAGDIREAGSDCLEDIDWREYRRASKRGQCSCRLSFTGRKGRNRKYFYYIGN